MSLFVSMRSADCLSIIQDACTLRMVFQPNRKLAVVPFHMTHSLRVFRCMSGHRE